MEQGFERGIGRTGRRAAVGQALVIATMVLLVFGSTSCARDEDNFHFGKNVSAADQVEIRAGVDALNQWLLSTRGSKMTNFSVFAAGNLNDLMVEFDAYGGGVGPGQLTGLLSFFGSGGAITVGPNVFIYTGAAWESASRTSHEFVVAHEAFHVAQFKLLNENERYLEAESGPNPPDWLIEGSADYAAARALDLAGVRPFADWEALEKRHAETVNARLQQLESTSPVHSPGDASPYSQGFMATELLTQAHGDAALLNFFEQASPPATPWPDAFQQAFGEDLQSFYGRYEATRNSAFPAYAGAVTGRLLDTDGNAAWGGVVLACNAETEACDAAWAGTDGRFEISVPDGSYHVLGASNAASTMSSVTGTSATVAGNAVDVGDIVKPGPTETH